MKEKNILPISMNNDFAVILGYALPLSVLRSEDTYEHWFYTQYMIPYASFSERFDLLCSIYDAQEYGGNLKIDNDILHFSKMPAAAVENIPDINAFLQSRIDLGNYGVIFMDYYYLPAMESIYQKRHFVHELMIYGYDRTRQVYQCVSYIQKLYSKFEIGFDDAARAVKSGCVKICERYGGWDELMFMQMEKVKYRRPIPYEPDLFLERLSQYCHSSYPERIDFSFRHREHYIHDESINHQCGRKIADVFLDYFTRVKNRIVEENSFESCFGDYHPVHMFNDFHKGILARMAYYAKMTDKEQEFAPYIKQYKTVVELCESIRMRYLKYEVIARIPRLQQTIKLLENIITDLEHIKRKEGEILSGFLEMAGTEYLKNHGGQE